MWLSSIALPPWLPSFPSKAFPPSISSLMSPLTVSLKSTADLTLGLLSNPYSPALSHCAFQGTRILSRVGKAVAKIVWFLFHSDCHRWAAALSNSVKCFSSVPNNCPDVGIWSLLQVPHPPEYMSSPDNSPFFPLLPSFYCDLCGFIHSFPVIKDSFSLSAGVLQDILCLKVYCWCIHGEKSTPHPSSPPPSIFSLFFLTGNLLSFSPWFFFV